MSVIGKGILTTLLLHSLIMVKIASGEDTNISLANSTINTHTKKSVIALLGSNVTLPCQYVTNSTNKQKIWKFDGTILFSGNNSYAPKSLEVLNLTENGDLFIPVLEYKYEGFYSCHFGNQPALYQYVVTVEVLPNISMKFAGDLVYSSDEDFLSSAKSYQMECHANGSTHNVSLSWYVNDVSYTGLEYITWNLDESNLTHTVSVILYRPKVGDVEISCQAIGQSKGSVRDHMPISVSLEKTQVIQIFQKYGRNFTRSCQSSSLMAIWEYPVRNNTVARNEGGVLHTEEVKIDNEGEYKCYKAGEETIIFNLTVEVTPELSIFVVGEDDLDDNVTLQVHKSYKLLCNATGAKSPASLSWEVNEEIYLRGLNTSRWASEDVIGTSHFSSFIIYTPSREDTHISCIVSDHQRGSPWNSTLLINTEESFIESITNASVIYGEGTSFCCNLSQSGQVYLWEFKTNSGNITDPLKSPNITEKKEPINNGSGWQSCLSINSAKISSGGYYSCLRMSELTKDFRLVVKVKPRINITFEDNPNHDHVVVYRYKQYEISCFVQGAYPAAAISWEINGMKTTNKVYHESPRSSVMGNDLYDTKSRLEYRPDENDRNITCTSEGIDRSYHEQIVLNFEEVITVDAAVFNMTVHRGDNLSFSCGIHKAEEKIRWTYEGTQLIMCGWKHCDNVKVNSRRNQLNLSIDNIDIKNDGKYSCYHGLEEIKVVYVKVTANLTIYLMPGVKRIYPDTIEVYEGTQYSFKCIANSTNEIETIHWQVNGINVPKESTSFVRDNTSQQLYQVISEFRYTPLISHLTISCVAEDRNGSIKHETVKIFFVLSLLKKMALWGGVTLVILLFMAFVVFICLVCWKCANRRTAQTSMELLERHQLNNVDKAAWRRSMQAFSKRSGSRYGLIRRSRMFLEMARVEVDEGVDVYDKFISQSFRRSVVQHSKLCFVMQLKSGTFKNRWMGTLRQRMKARTGTFISTVSDSASEDKQFRWDMFVKSVIELPTTRHIASIIGISMHNGRLYLIQEFLQVENLKTYFEANLRILTSAGFVSKHVVRIARGVVDGMEYLTLNEFCHPALSIQKIMISQDEECKLYDFCLFEDAPAKIESIICKNKQSFSNLAIETILRDEYTVLSDVWSLGTALWEIFSLGEEPFKGLQQEDIKLLLARGHQLPQPAHCSRQFFHVMMDCWVDSQERPSISTVRNNLKAGIREYIETVAASGDEMPQRHASIGHSRGPYIDAPNTYNIPAGTSKGSEENIYEKMDGTLKTFSK